MKQFKWISTASFLIAVSCSALSCQSPFIRESRVEIAGDAQEPVVRFQPAEVPDGGLVRLELTFDFPEPISVQGSFEKIDFNFFKTVDSTQESQRFEALVAIPFGQKPGLFPIAIRTSKGHELKVLVPVVAGAYASETLSVDPRHIKPPPKALERMRREASEVGRIYRNSVPQVLWSGEFGAPLSTSITSSFGTKRVYNGQMQSFHTGTDYKASVGTPVYASAGGRVAMAKDLYMTGKTVILDHGYGLFTIYAHLSDFKVKKGDSVAKSQPLGLSGATGRTSGPHLHWAAVVHRTKFNPLDLLKLR